MKRILCIGDSITDCGRHYEDLKSLGDGYVSIIRNHLSESQYEVINKGISGNKLADVLERLDKDCISLKPDIVSILIGINDTWHFMREETYDIEAEIKQFEKIYRALIEKLKNSGIHSIRIMEPFVLPYPEDRKTWRTDLDKRIQVIRQVAKDYHCEFIALDGMLNAAGINEDFKQYAEDGVHPSLKGHQLIAKEWLKGFKG